MNISECFKIAKNLFSVLTIDPEDCVSFSAKNKDLDFFLSIHNDETYCSYIGTHDHKGFFDSRLPEKFLTCDWNLKEEYSSKKYTFNEIKDFYIRDPEMRFSLCDSARHEEYSVTSGTQWKPFPEILQSIGDDLFDRSINDIKRYKLSVLEDPSWLMDISRILDK